MTSYFAQANPNALPYGFVPEIASLKTVVLSSGTGTTVIAPATPAKAVASSVPKDPADVSLQGVAGLAEAGKRSEEGVGSRGEGAPEAVAADEATYKGAKGAEKAAQHSEKLPVTAVESEEDLDTFVAAAAGSDRLVLVDFGAEWCKNCKAILVSERSSRAICELLGVRLGRCVLFLVWALVRFEAPLSLCGRALLDCFVDRWDFNADAKWSHNLCASVWRCTSATYIASEYFMRWFHHLLPPPAVFLVATRADAMNA